MKRIEEENKKQRSKITEDVKKKKEETREKERLQEKERERLMVDGEKDLWESGDWRDHIKDLNSSFSKVCFDLFHHYHSFGNHYSILVSVATYKQGQEEKRKIRSFYL